MKRSVLESDEFVSLSDLDDKEDDDEGEASSSQSSYDAPSSLNAS